MHEIANIEPIDSRLHDLNTSYLGNAIVNNNQLILQLINEYGDFSNREKSPLTILGHYAYLLK